MFAKEVIDTFYGPKAHHPTCVSNVMYGDTDSLFIEFTVVNPDTRVPLTGREARQAVIDLTAEAGHLVTKALAPPHDFEFDKAFYPFIIFSKKRYVGNMYEENADDFYQKSMGLATKRRDYANIVKTIYGGAIKILLMNKDVGAAAAFVKKWITDLMDNKVSLNQLLLTKSLRSEYKSATPPAHKVLAERITKRDPGNAPASGDRLSFVYVKQPPGFKGGQGDRIETPAFMKANGLKPDPEFYIEHQLENPIGQLFSILVDQLPGVRPPPQGWNSDPDMQAAEREIYAKDYLFKASKQKNTNTLFKAWGLADSARAPVATSLTSRAKPKTMITRADQMILDQLLVAASKRKPKK
jgi:DNA polymerase elongation subunit (family B)